MLVGLSWFVLPLLWIFCAVDPALSVPLESVAYSLHSQEPVPCFETLKRTNPLFPVNVSIDILVFSRDLSGVF
jgi:hypothetical protein